MRTGIPSITALAVAIARGVGALPDPNSRTSWRVPDPLAHRFLSPFGPAIAWLGHRSTRSAAARTFASLASLGLVDHVSLRTAAIDAALLARIPHTAQLVIVGAGLDARAWRLELGDIDVFEVDHPDTQRFKRRQAHTLEPRSHSHHYVGVDFTRDNLDDALTTAGHDPSRPTFWIWEGVTMYLPHDATRHTLNTLRQRSAPRSALAMTYATGEMINLPRAIHPLVLQGFGVLGEPLRGLLSSDAIDSLARDEGWTPHSDTASTDWAAAYHVPAPKLVISERLMVCEAV